MPHRSLFVSILGAPNAGKSTLINRLVGTKVSIVSPRAQTTRSRIRGIITEGDTQLVLIDTPGIFAAKPRFEKAMVQAAWNASGEDTLILLIDSKKGIQDDTRHILEGLKQRHKTPIIVLNKVDTVAKEKLLALAAELQSFFVPHSPEIFMISALKGDGVNDLKQSLLARAPEQPWCYPEDQVSDINDRLLAAEITREKLFLRLREELPYALAVETEQWEDLDNGGVKVHQVITVQREAHKKIVIGKQGATLKAIGEAARKELSRLLERTVHVFLFVRVREDWKSNPESLRLYGLEE